MRFDSMKNSGVGLLERVANGLIRHLHCGLNIVRPFALRRYWLVYHKAQGVAFHEVYHAFGARQDYPRRVFDFA